LHKKNISDKPPAGFSRKKLFNPALGCLDGIEFGFLLLDGNGHMGGHITNAVLPFRGRVRGRGTIRPDFIFPASGAPAARFHDRITGTSVIRASAFGHEYTFFTLSNRCTNHSVSSVIFFFYK
jgi:hypothetical protein